MLAHRCRGSGHFYFFSKATLYIILALMLEIIHFAPIFYYFM